MSSSTSSSTSSANSSHYFCTMPAEWAPHAACLLLYPHNPSTFRLELARAEVLQTARAIAGQGNEPVVLFCQTRAQADICLSQYQQQQRHLTESERACERIIVLVCPSNDTWARDTGPTFVVASNGDTDNGTFEKKLVGLDWDFNAYGGPQEGCYWPCDLDQQVASRMCRALSDDSSLNTAPIETLKIPLILEGGSIHTDGEGTILTTKECLGHTNRNPNMSQEEVQDFVLKATGCTKMIWLDTGLANDDDTNGHVDNFCVFVPQAAATVLLAWTDDAVNDAENYQRCRAALQVLESETNAKRQRLTVHKLHLPAPMAYSKQEAASLQPLALADGTTVAPRQEGERMAASYVNFYVANEAVIVPQFGDVVADARAIETLTPLFPGRTIVGVQSREILIGGGNIHCVTQQLPFIAHSS